MKYDDSFSRGLRIGFPIAMLILLLMAFLSYRQVTRLIDAGEEVDHTQDVIINLEQIISLIKDAETGQRGFFLTRNEAFLAPYHNSYQRVVKEYQSLVSMTRDNPSQQIRLDTLQTLIRMKYDIIREEIESLREGKVYDTRLIEKGGQVMEKIRALVNRMEAEEQSLLKARNLQNNWYVRSAPPMIIVFSMLALIVAMSAYYRSIRDLSTVRQAEREVHIKNQDLATALQDLRSTEECLIALNHDLERRVSERTVLLEEQKEALHNLFMQVPALIGIFRGREGRVELFNATFSQLWGHRPVIGKTMREALPELEGQGYFDIVENVYDTGESVIKHEFPAHIDRQNNGVQELAYFDFIYAPYRDLTGAIDGVIMYGVEVTDHVMSRDKLKNLNKELAQKNEELAASEEEIRQTLDKTIELNDALIEQENFLSSIIDQTPVSTWIANGEGTQIRVNEACMRLFGVEDASLGLGKYNILRDETLMNRPFFKDIQAVFTEGKIAKFRGEYNLSKVQHVQIPTGKQIYLVVTVFPIKDALGKVTHAVVQHEDITMQKQAEDALKASVQRFRFLAEAMPQKVWTAQPNGEIDYYNRRWMDYTHLNFEELKGWGWVNVVHPDDYRDNVQLWKQSIAQGTDFRSEHRLKRYDGEYRWHLSRGLAQKDAEGKVMLWVGTHTDIHDLKIAEEELILKNKELQKVNADLDNFIYTASHDLKSPIANIEGLTLALYRHLNDQMNPAVEKVMEMISRSITIFKTTIADLTEISKVQKNIEEKVEEVSFREVLEEVKSDISDMLTHSGATILEDFQVASILYGKHNIRSILYNLLSNAVKYRFPHRPPVIQVNTYRKEGSTVLSIKDNGLGLNPAQQAKMFEMFKRLHTHVEGTGIGLYIVKRIVENNGGYITVDSEVDQGTTFTIDFQSV